jgi:NAD(P)-dependent dehydrogenase (short-subunit alcohol dehydrogenase family)
LALINPLNRLILVARTEEKAEQARDQVLEALPNNAATTAKDHVIALACDQCSLTSVRDLLPRLQQALNDTYSIEKWAHNGIDVACLNAATLQSADSNDATFTADGLETTFQTNYVSAFLLANLLRPYINVCGRVVFTSSALYLRHELDLSGVVADAPFAMVNGRDYHYKDAYSLSKLCLAAACAELNARHPNVTWTSFSPGLMLDSGLFRNQRLPYVLPQETRAEALAQAKNVLWGAGALAYMAWADAPGEKGAQFWRDATCQGVSARYGHEFCPMPIDVDQSARKQLWSISCELAGINDDST